jgi:hypothetical protein
VVRKTPPLKNMIKFIKGIFKRNPKKLSQTKLFEITLKKKRNDWEKILDKMVEYAVSVAQKGQDFIVVKQELLMVEYNQDRTKHQILQDVKNRFVHCDCHFEYSVIGQENIRICWKKV